MNLKVGEIYLWKSDIFPSSQIIVLHKILYIKNSYVTMDKYELERRKNNRDFDIKSYQCGDYLDSGYILEFIEKGIKITEEEWNKFKNIFNSFSKFFIKFPEVRKNEKLVKDAGVYAKAHKFRPEIKSIIKITINKNKTLSSKELNFSKEPEELGLCNIGYKSYSISHGIKVLDDYKLANKDWYKRVRCYNYNSLKCNYLFNKYYGFKSR